MSDLTDLLALSHVPRWVIVRHTTPQSVADHSFRVAIIYRELCGRLPPRPIARNDALWHALIHDQDEAITGDIPAGAKDHKEPVDRLLKLADLIEAYTFISMNGAGMHAKEVASHLGGDIIEFCRKHQIDTVPVMAMCHEILNEEGRLRTRL